jgi:Asp-tRNA(Asn)/Glu-tRNA(Gln) amidotransferase A subunit family amidase
MSAALAYLGLAEAAEVIRRRELSPVELTRALIERVERLDPALGAFLPRWGAAGLRALDRVRETRAPASKLTCIGKVARI